jgi:hypothetical protein
MMYMKHDCIDVLACCRMQKCIMAMIFSVLLLLSGGAIVLMTTVFFKKNGGDVAAANAAGDSGKEHGVLICTLYLTCRTA